MEKALDSFDFQVNHDLVTTMEALRSRCATPPFAADATRIDRAMRMAEDAHRGQLRGDGSPYIVHPIRTALLAIRYEDSCSSSLVIACLLHDTLEDTALVGNDIAEAFGTLVASYVLAVTRYRPRNETPEEKFQAKRKKWEELLKADRQVRLIKTFDYCDNVISWKFIRPGMPAFKKIPRWLREARELYLPLARITNEEAAGLIDGEIGGYLHQGFRIGTRLDA